MNNIRKKIFAVLMVAVVCITSTCIPVLAKETNNIVISDEPRANSTLIPSTGGILSGNKTYVFDVPSNGTYTVTLSVQILNGSDGIWLLLTNSTTSYIDTNVTSSLQKKVYLPAGTYTIYLTTSGTCSYGLYVY